MEDAATAEISRTQVWQWLKFNARLDDGRKLTQELYKSILAEEVIKIRHVVGEGNMHNTKFEEAIALFDKLVQANEFEEFLTLKAYNEI